MDKVPGLGDIPILGQLFKSRRFQRSETELAIFVTPVLVSADHPSLVQRVDQSQQILNATFSQPPLINTPVVSVAGLPPVIAASDGLYWDPRSGEGTQWQAGPSSPSVESHGRPNPGRHNRRLFKE